MMWRQVFVSVFVGGGALACAPPASNEPPRAANPGYSASLSEASPEPESEPEPTAAEPELTTPGQGVRDVDSAPEVQLAQAAKSVSDQARCPGDMVQALRVGRRFCVDAWENSLVWRNADGSDGKKPSYWPGNRYIDGKEKQLRAVSVGGRNPQGYIAGDQAAEMCAASGKRLCEIDEWVHACRGPARTRYPYGNVRKKGVCNDRYKVLDHHPVVTLFKRHAPPDEDPIKMWHPSWMNDKRLHELAFTIHATGKNAECTNEYGAYDMVGNLHEWVADPDGTFFGGYFMDTFQNGEGCEYRTKGHPYNYHDYSTGFRCCADVGAETLPSPASK